MVYRLAIALVLLAALAFASGCSTGCPRTAEPTAGDFYTEEEYQQLTNDQREAYCAALLQAYREGEDCVGRAEGDLGKESRAVTDLEQELAKIEPQLRSLKGEIEALEREIAYFEGLPNVYIVKKGDFLYKISEMEAIYADPLKWRRIYRANREIIDDPNLIYPDQELTIPRDWPHTYTVKEGDSLWRIARFWEIYDDGRMWERIHAANPEIANPDLIQPGQVLTIPR